MTTVACPQCGNDTITVSTWVESDGASPYVSDYTAGEISDQRCPCALTDDQETTAVQQGIQAAEDGAGADWIERE